MEKKLIYREIQEYEVVETVTVGELKKRKNSLLALTDTMYIEVDGEEKAQLLKADWYYLMDLPGDTKLQLLTPLDLVTEYKELTKQDWERIFTEL